MLGPEEEVTATLIERERQSGMLCIGHVTPQTGDTHHSGLHEAPNHKFHVMRRIHRIRIYVEVVLAMGMLQTAQSGISTTVLLLGEEGYATATENLCGTVTRVIIHTNDFHREGTLHVGQ